MEETSATTIQIGDLLVKSGIVDPGVLDEVNLLAFKMRLPIGRILTMHNHVSESVFAAALEAQARVRDQALPLDRATKALGVVAKDEVSLDEALQKLAPQAKAKSTSAPRPVPTENRLGEILMQSGFATPRQVEDALVAVAETGLPLGMVLHSIGIISRSGLNSALAAQKLIRNGQDRDKIIYSLKMARLRSISLRESLKENQIDPELLQHEFGTGELMVLAGAISESQLMSCRELEIVEARPLEQIIIDNGFASKMCMQAVKQLLRMISEGMLFEEQAAQIVKKTQFASSHDEFNRALAALNEESDEEIEDRAKYEVTDVLRRAGLISDKELQIATSLALANRQPLLKTLFDAKLIDQRAMDMASRCKTYLDHNLIQIEQATIVITYALENNLTVDETIDCFGWSAPAE